MVEIINYDSKCVNWDKRGDINEACIRANINWLIDLCRNRGYIYLTDIYNAFGAAWDPSNSNDCMIYGKNEPRFSYQKMNDTDYKVNIYY